MTDKSNFEKMRDALENLSLVIKSYFPDRLKAILLEQASEVDALKGANFHAHSMIATMKIELQQLQLRVQQLEKNHVSKPPGRTSN